MITLLLVFTVCFKGECHEYIAESYVLSERVARIQCELDGKEFEQSNSTVWHCSKPEDYTKDYFPKISLD